MPRTTPTITITGLSGPRTVPAAWRGDRLAVNRPVLKEGLGTAPRTWVVTHLEIGYSLGTVNAPQRAVIALAKAWDHPAAGLEALSVENARHWRWARRWLDDCSRAGRGLPVIGPRELTPMEAIESAGTAAEVQAAVAAAMGAPQFTDAEAAEAFPVADVLPADRVHFATLPGDDTPEGRWPMVRWARQWWPAPTLGEVHAWALDSVAKTPDGRTVEPDHPHAWPRLLGLI
jgi:hypothetical protein